MKTIYEGANIKFANLSMTKNKYQGPKTKCFVLSESKNEENFF